MNTQLINKLLIANIIIGVFCIPCFATVELLRISSDVEVVTIDEVNYSRHIIHVIADDPSNIAFAWDGKFQGPMRQTRIQLVPGAPWVSTPMRDMFFLNPAQEKYDSHFMFYEGTFFNADNPETYPYANQLTVRMNIKEASIGLEGIFGLMPSRATLPNQPGAAQDLVFAQILVPEGETVSMIGAFADGNGIITPVNIPDIGLLSTRDFIFAKLPEPSILALMSIGVLMLRSFRKHE